jgi:hypothetical protein
MLKLLATLLCISSIYGFKEIVNEFVNDGKGANDIEIDSKNDFVTSVVEPHTKPFQVNFQACNKVLQSNSVAP